MECDEFFFHLTASCDLIPLRTTQGFLLEVFPQTETAFHLKTFWEGFCLANKNHEVVREHNDDLQRVLPLYWHGDEGTGSKRYHQNT